MNYKKKIFLEGKAFDKQVKLRKKFGLIPDLRKLKKNYNFYNNPWREPEFFKIQWMKIIYRIIKDASSKKKKQKILEIGCGTGFLSLELARNGNDVLGIDVSKKSIAEAKSYLKKIDKKKELKLNYEVKDAHKIDFNVKFDVIIFYRSLHHFKNVKKLLKRINDNLRPGGTLIICEPLRKNFSKLNAIFSMIFRLSLETWIKTEKKIPKNINFSFIKSKEREIFKEYKYLKKNKTYAQSPMDNSTDNPEKVISSIKNFFKIIKIQYYDGFVDKLIGGLRGKHRFKIAKLLKEFDNYLIKENIIKGTTLYLVAKKK